MMLLMGALIGAIDDARRGPHPVVRPWWATPGGASGGLHLVVPLVGVPLGVVPDDGL